MGRRVEECDLVVVHDRLDVVLCSFLYFFSVMCIFVEFVLLSSYVGESIDCILFVVLIVIGVIFTIIRVTYRVTVKDDTINGIKIDSFDGYKYNFWNQLSLIYNGRIVIRVNIYDKGYSEFEKYVNKNLKEL